MPDGKRFSYQFNRMKRFLQNCGNVLRRHAEQGREKNRQFTFQTNGYLVPRVVWNLGECSLWCGERLADLCPPESWICCSKTATIVELHPVMLARLIQQPGIVDWIGHRTPRLNESDTLE